MSVGLSAVLPVLSTSPYLFEFVYVGVLQEPARLSTKMPSSQEAVPFHEADADRHVVPLRGEIQVCLLNGSHQLICFSRKVLVLFLRRFDRTLVSRDSYSRVRTSYHRNLGYVCFTH